MSGNGNRLAATANQLAPQELVLNAINTVAGSDPVLVALGHQEATIPLKSGKLKSGKLVTAGFEVSDTGCNRCRITVQGFGFLTISPSNIRDERASGGYAWFIGMIQGFKQADTEIAMDVDGSANVQVYQPTEHRGAREIRPISRDAFAQFQDPNNYDVRISRIARGQDELVAIIASVAAAAGLDTHRAANLAATVGSQFPDGQEQP